MGRHVIVGAGPAGGAVALKLADEGHDVTLVTRSGAGPRRRGVVRQVADPTERLAIAEIAKGADALFNCANPRPQRWEKDWPRISDALRYAAEAGGATLVSLSDLGVYGPPQGPMTPHDPLVATYPKAMVRAQMWRRALESHEAGRLRAVEVRSSDLIGPRVHGQLGESVVSNLVRGKRVRVVGDPEVAHTWTYVNDVAVTLVRCALDSSTWGRAWHVPSNEPRSIHEVLDDLAAAAGLARIPVSSIPRRRARVRILFDRPLRDLAATSYRFDSPFVMDDRETRGRLHQWPTPWPLVLNATLAPAFSLP